MVESPDWIDCYPLGRTEQEVVSILATFQPFMKPGSTAKVWPEEVDGQTIWKGECRVNSLILVTGPVPDHIPDRDWPSWWAQA